MAHKTITEVEVIHEARTRVLLALDEYMQELTGHDDAIALRDAELPLLFPALDKVMGQVIARYNDPQSKEKGAENLTITVSE